MANNAGDSATHTKPSKVCFLIIIYMKYTIIWSVYTYGSITQVVEKEQVKAECERLRKISIAGGNERKNTFKTIEVVNNETGEIREYWNNHSNEIQF